jgi:Cdc6-like AAA superfamily ATPase
LQEGTSLTTALFAGPTGTGKTLAVDLLGQELPLVAYRIDLNHIISKHIGESEKNLGQLYDLRPTQCVVRSNATTSRTLTTGTPTPKSTTSWN